MFKIGRRVRFIDADRHERMPWCYPPAGSMGTIIKVCDDETALVNWGKDNGVDRGDDYAWWASFNNLEAVDGD